MMSKCLLHLSFYLFLLSACTSPPEKSHDSHTNLLFILTDEQRFDTSLPYGNRLIQTPNLNRFAEQSIVCERAYVTQPVCSPARSSLMTGLYPHQTGVLTNNIPLKSSFTTLPEYLGDAYHSAYIGKWHLGRELDAWQGFQTRISTEDGYTKTDTSRFSDYHHWLRDQGYVPDDQRYKTFSRDFCARLPLAYTKSVFMEEQAIAFLEANQTVPFALVLGFLEPHTPNVGPFNDLHDPKQIALDSTYGWVSPKYFPLREQLIRNHDSTPTDRASLQQEMANYWGLVHQIDRSIGAILQRLDELNLDDNTLVIFTSEHGKMMGKFGLQPKRTMYDASARIPLMMRLPNKELAGTIVSEPVSQIDVLPTVLDVLDRPVETSLPGKSLLSKSTLTSRPVFIEWHPNVNQDKRYPNCPDGYTEEACELARWQHIRTVITPSGWKMSWSARNHDVSQLFHLPSDPLEANNLFYEPVYQDTIIQLKQILIDWQVQVKDTVLL